jgi:hypothetical protein
MSVNRQTLEDIFGPDNIVLWADLNNKQNQAFIERRITAAIAFANARFTELTTSGPVVDPDSVTVKDVIAKLAGIWLYESRGINEDDASKSPVFHHKKYINEWVQSHLHGRLGVARAPFVL